jgi:putative DNA primase/helicase
MALDGLSFLEACEVVTETVAHTPTAPVETLPDEKDAQRQYEKLAHQRALAFARAAGPIEDTLAWRYLTQTRGLEVPEGMSGRVLFFHPASAFGDEVHPCLIGLYRDIITNDPRAIHRTALDENAQKIGRKALGSVRGAVIKLTPDVDVSYGLTIGEGLETTLAAMQLGFKPAWAVGDANGIAGFPVLAGIDALTIAVDHDASGTGQRAADVCEARWLAAGREVIRVMGSAKGDDIADVVTS